MTRRKLVRVIVAVLIAAVLGGAYAIIANNRDAGGPEPEMPSGFYH